MSILGSFIHHEIASQQISKESFRWWKHDELESEEICLMVNFFFKDTVSWEYFTKSRYSLRRRKTERLVKARKSSIAY